MYRDGYIDAITKTDEPYNLTAGVLTIAAVAAVVVAALFLSGLAAQITIGCAVGSLLVSGIVYLIGNYKRNNEMTDRYNERYRDRLRLEQKSQEIWKNKQPYAVVPAQGARYGTQPAVYYPAPTPLLYQDTNTPQTIKTSADTNLVSQNNMSAGVLPSNQ